MQENRFSWKVFVTLKLEIVLNIIFFQKSLEIVIYNTNRENLSLLLYSTPCLFLKYTFMFFPSSINLFYKRVALKLKEFALTAIFIKINHSEQPRIDDLKIIFTEKYNNKRENAGFLQLDIPLTYWWPHIFSLLIPNDHTYQLEVTRSIQHRKAKYIADSFKADTCLTHST